MSEVSFSEEAGMRYLHFGSEWVQGAMKIATPNSLELTYVRDMMSWLLFLDPPSEITQLGLGAASLTKYCLAHCSPSKVTAVELSDTVIMAAQMWFKLPYQHKRLNVVHDDAAAYLARELPRTKPNILQVDVYDEKARGPVLDSPAFYQDCFRILGGHEGVPGIAVFNFFGSKHFIKSREKVAKVFGGKIVCLPACYEGNIIVLAFCGPELNLPLEGLKARARVIETQYGLPVWGWLYAMQQPANRWLIAP
jgi:spermidine synthase